MYSQGAALEPPPKPAAETREARVPVGPTSDAEATSKEMEKVGAEMISFENLTEAVMEEEMFIPPREEGPPLAGEEVSPVKEEIESREPPEVAPEEAISEKLTGVIADRIVKEVTDRLVSRMEKIIWEVVPDLAEALISKEIERIKAAAEEQETS